jgi:hypothetical protein
MLVSVRYGTLVDSHRIVQHTARRTRSMTVKGRDLRREVFNRIFYDLRCDYPFLGCLEKKNVLL